MARELYDVLQDLYGETGEEPLETLFVRFWADALTSNEDALPDWIDVDALHDSLLEHLELEPGTVQDALPDEE